jgi:hypothetical protein
MAYQGTYASSTNYALNDAVSDSGSSYISLIAGNHGNTPGQSPAAWAVLALEGAAGAAGAAGPAGAQGPAGAAGSTGATGATGSAGAPGINFRGPWVTRAGYAVNDSVTFGGSTYLAQISNASVEPDTNATVWAVLAAAGGAGPTGPSATVQVGSVTTGAAGSSAIVTNSGSTTAAVLNFTIPQGAAGAAATGGGSGGGGSGTSGIPYASTYHSVSYSNLFFSVNNANEAATEAGSVLTWLPNGCTATQLQVFSQQSSSTLLVTLRSGAPGSMADTALACSPTTGASCSASGSVAIPAGSFVDLNVTHASSTEAPVWTVLTCN